MDVRLETAPERIEAFLHDLRKISLKHGVVIGGCGCCGSPWASTLNKASVKKMKGRYKTDTDGCTKLEWE